MRYLTLIFSLSLTLSACGGGGGSSSDTGTVFQGTLTERGVGHLALSPEVVTKHSSGQRIGDVKICVLSECSITDDLGQWGVNVENFTGGTVTITADGHGISSSVSEVFPAYPKEITLELDHNRNKLTIASGEIDGTFFVPLPIP
jgi:hypothetical protein